jgi:hypothetical protein
MKKKNRNALFLTIFANYFEKGKHILGGKVSYKDVILAKIEKLVHFLLTVFKGDWWLPHCCNGEVL